MKYRRLGRTDLDVSLICLGTMTWGEQNSEAEAHQQLDYAVAQGVNFIDTAEMYPVPPRAATQGRSEAYLGSWLAQRGRREDLVIATKVMGPSDADYVRGGPRLTRRQVVHACEESLQRLQLDYIDLYQVHWPERPTNYFGRLGYEVQDDPDAIEIEETLGALAELVEAGKARYVGVSNETPWGVHEYLRLADRHGWPRIQSIQNPYNLLNRSYEIGLAEFSHREDLSLLAYSPLACGTLSGKYLDAQRPPGARLTRFDRFQRYSGELAETAIRQYVELARAHGLDPAAMALAYVNTRPFLGATIIGATTMEQLAADIASLELRLPAELVAGIEAIHRRQPNPCP